MTLLLHKEIEKLKKMLLELMAVVEENLTKAVLSLENRDCVLAQEVIDSDQRIDQMEVDLEEEGLKILALHQPVAIDLRFIISALRTNNELERIGDTAVNLAERATFLCGEPPLNLPVDLPTMADKAQEMLRMSLDAFVNMDVPLAVKVIKMDDEVDEMNREAFKVIYETIRKIPDRAEALIHTLSATRHLERIGDHATNIAEDVVYLVEGEIIRHLAEDFSTGDLQTKRLRKN
ncbi:MAG: phosphate signaling complex protein PhoU [bacterium]|nr:phosphate signaling complex protein PhoU [bacterium]MDT8365673.1 phosphate signaling complex protein PhoU [bacterium]